MSRTSSSTLSSRISDIPLQTPKVVKQQAWAAVDDIHDVEADGRKRAILLFHGRRIVHRKSRSGDKCDEKGMVFRSWNILIQLFVVLLVLPVVLGLWIWQTRWPSWVRLVLVVGLAWMTEYTFFPRLLFA